MHMIGTGIKSMEGVMMEVTGSNGLGNMNGTLSMTILGMTGMTGITG